MAKLQRKSRSILTSVRAQKSDDLNVEKQYTDDFETTSRAPTSGVQELIGSSKEELKGESIVSVLPVKFKKLLPKRSETSLGDDPSDLDDDIDDEDDDMVSNKRVTYKCLWPLSSKNQKSKSKSLTKSKKCSINFQLVSKRNSKT